MSTSNINDTSNLESKALLLTIHGPIATITLNRANHGNALNLEMASRLAEAVDEILNTASVRAILITGAGNNFCVGGDIRAFIEEREDLLTLVEALLEPLNNALYRLEASKLPIVSALNGPVGGAGIALALIADFVLAAESVKLRCGYTAIGLTPDAGSSWLLAKRIGSARAKQLFLTNTALDAQECLNLGIIDKLHPNAELMDQTHALLSKLINGPAKAMSRVKHLLDHSMTHRTFKDHLELERQLIIRSASEEDVQEGILAFTEKRQPSFS